jgi:nucleotide-binding universal stress UspA family protein
MAEKKRILVVANQTAESDELRSALRARSQQGAAEFTLLVPATPHGLAWAADMAAGQEEAQHHLDAMVERLRAIGLDVREAKVGDPDALAAVQDEANFTSYDEVIVSTLPLHLSKWLRIDLPRKVEAATGLPVMHVEAAKVPTA